jgi:hypothetical protein
LRSFVAFVAATMFELADETVCGRVGSAHCTSDTRLTFADRSLSPSLRADVGMTAVRGVVAALFADVPDLALRIEDEPLNAIGAMHVRVSRTTQREADHLLQWFLGKHELSAHANVLAERNWDSFPALLRVPVEELIAATRASGVDASDGATPCSSCISDTQLLPRAPLLPRPPAVVDVAARSCPTYDDDDDDVDSTRSDQLQGAVGVEVFDLSTVAKQRATFRRELKKKAVAAAATARRVLHDSRRRVCACATHRRQLVRLPHSI